MQNHNNQPLTFLITGAAHGLGAELARQLSAQQFQLILLDKDKAALNQLSDQLSEQNPNIYLFPIDLAGSSAAEFAILTEALQAFEQLDGMILNAASLPGLTPISNLDPIQWYEILQTNLNANFHLIQSCLPWLQTAIKTNNQAWLCGISDQITEQNKAYFGAYAVAKAGLEQLIKLTSLETPGLVGVIAKPQPIAGHFRAKIYPAENPTDNQNLTSYQQVTNEIIQACLQQQATEQITIINHN